MIGTWRWQSYIVCSKKKIICKFVYLFWKILSNFYYQTKKYFLKIRQKLQIIEFWSKNLSRIIQNLWCHFSDRYFHLEKSLSLILPLSLSHSLIPSLSLSLSTTLSFFPLFLSFFPSLSLSHSLSRSLSLSLALSLFLSSFSFIAKLTEVILPPVKCLRCLTP